MDRTSACARSGPSFDANAGVFPLLDPRQRSLLLDAIQYLEKVTGPADLKMGLESLVGGLIPFSMVLCGLAQRSHGQITDQWIMAHRVPPEFQSLTREAEIRGWPLLHHWLRCRTPQVLAQEPMAFGRLSTGADPGAPAPPHGERAPLQRIALHGAVEHSGACFSWFCFGGVSQVSAPQQAHLLRLLAPHLHFTLLRIRGAELSVGRQHAVDSLTEQQREILRWVQLGKTNSEVAAILATSTANIKYHIRQILRKLDVTNRTQAAMHMAHAEECAAGSPGRRSPERDQQ